MIAWIRRTIPKLLRFGLPKSSLAVEAARLLPPPAVKGSSSPSDDDPHRLSGVYLAKRGVDDQRRFTLRYWHGQFWRWNGRYYRPIKDDLRAEVTEVTKREFDRIAKKKSPLQVRTSLVANVIQALAGKTLVDEQRDQPCWLGDPAKGAEFISMANGLVSMEELMDARATVRPPTPEWFSTVSLPYAYKADAKCPNWMAFLNTVLENDCDRIKLLQEFFGYLLTPDTSLQKFLMFLGDGANGKSVVCKILTALLGPANVSSVPLEVFADRFQLTSSRGKLANIVTEVGHLKTVAEGVLKQFTGGDRMHFDRKNLSPVEEIPTARLVIATNHPPPFVDQSSGVWRRVIPIPFRVTIPVEQQDRNLAEKLMDELPGIFNWAIEGKIRLRQQGRFTESEVCSEVLIEYRNDNDPVRRFLTEEVEIKTDGMVYSEELYSGYCTWCKTEGHEPSPSRLFFRHVYKQFPGAKRAREKTGNTGHRSYFIRGIRLVNSNVDSPDPAQLRRLAFGG